jgi:hypothetical protein
LIGHVDVLAGAQLAFSLLLVSRSREALVLRKPI